jgi:hypothetical protein
MSVLIHTKSEPPGLLHVPEDLPCEWKSTSRAAHRFWLPGSIEAQIMVSDPRGFMACSIAEMLKRVHGFRSPECLGLTSIR